MCELFAECNLKIERVRSIRAPEPKTNWENHKKLITLKMGAWEDVEILKCYKICRYYVDVFSYTERLLML